MLEVIQDNQIWLYFLCSLCIMLSFSLLVHIWLCCVGFMCLSIMLNDWLEITFLKGLILCQFGLMTWSEHISVIILLSVALVRSKGAVWASVSMNQQPANVPHAVFLHRNLDLQQLTYPTNKIIFEDQVWHFLCSGADGMLHLMCWYFTLFYLFLYTVCLSKCR